VGVVATGIIAWKQGQKAKKIVEQAESAKGSKLTFGENLRATWKQKLIVLISILATCGTAAAGYFIQASRLAEATAACQVLMASNKELQSQIDDISLQAPEVVNKVKEEHLRDFGERTLTTYDDCAFYKTKQGATTKFVDAFLGTKFYSTPTDVAAAISRFQHRYEMSKTGVTIDDLYECLGVMKEGIAPLSMGWFKAASVGVDKYDVPDVDVRRQTFYDEDIYSGEPLDTCEEIYVISYYPQCFDGKYVVSKDNSYRPQNTICIDPGDLEV
jgi:hypothetical protein